MKFNTIKFEEIRQQLETITQFELITVMGLHQEKACRCYTNRPDIYALSGMKDTIKDDWYNLVITNKTPFICHDQKTLIDILKDETQFIANNWGAAVNLPVQHNGNVIGTVNLLSKADAFKTLDLDNAVTIVQQSSELIAEFVESLMVAEDA
ncbi:hypothetical protein L0B53_12255 [Vibrio sp. SS-MA-C1-2]|uniref:hypothetical protein n=1 Tax=Vibrio sp. SS-MA-C1-2 TaxID=2908646 RepID=UPI001F3A204B|nr:hypothetical protein [Vibrio sp. SS-MA-C1-2]UJF17798.1 hypothetical protein L0B53_12255 [Vibrio sp. SS-MA-C1-2]